MRRIGIPRRGARGAVVVLAALFCLPLGAGPASAEGSRSLYPSGYAGSRGNLDLQPGTAASPNKYVNRVLRRTFLYVHAQAGEYILLGSRNRSNGGDIFVYNPQGFGVPGDETIPTTADFSCSSGSSQPGTHFSGGTLGTIANRAQELAGPNSADNTALVSGGFVPCAYQAPVTGIYGVLFSAATTGGGPNGVIDPPALSNNSVSAWDVTVRATAGSTADINGRLFTYAWNGFTGGNSRPVNSTHYYVTGDGYRYAQDLRGLDPNGYALYANSLGFLDNSQPLYKDLRGERNPAQPSDPNPAALVQRIVGGAGITSQIAEYPIFFSDVDPTGANAAEIDRVLQALSIPLEPPIPTVSALSFTGNLGGPTSTVGAGGTFRFTTTNTITYQIVISRDGSDFDPNNPSNRVLTGIARTGTHAISWDGKDGDGANFPPGTYPFNLIGRNGEVHFPIIDAENNPNGGPTVTRLNGPRSGDTTVYFDDRGYVTSSGSLIGNLNGTLCPGPAPAAPNPPVHLEGVDSATAYRFWPSGSNPNTDCATTAGWGDAKALDLWTFFSTEPLDNDLSIEPILIDVATRVTAPAFAAGGSAVQGAFRFANNGNSPAAGVTYGLTLAPGLGTVAFGSLPAGVGAVFDNATGAVTFTGFPALLAAGQAFSGMTFGYTAPTTGSVTATATIATSSPDTYPENNSASATTWFGEADVYTQVTVPTSAMPGDTVRGTFVFGNLGSNPAAGVTYTATIGGPGFFPPDLSFPVLPSGVSATYDPATGAVSFTGLPETLVPAQGFTFELEYTAPTSGFVAVATAIETASGDANPTNNAASGVTSFAQADLVIAKTNGGEGVVTGATTTYRLTVTNAGPGAADGSQVTDPPAMGLEKTALTCDSASGGAQCPADPTVEGLESGLAIPALPIGGSLAFVVTARVTAGRGAAVVNVATVTPPAGVSDPDLGNNSARDSDLVAGADVYTTVEVPASVAPGDPVTGLVTFGNQGDAPAVEVAYTPTLPTGLTGVSCGGATCDYDPATGTVTLSGLPSVLMPGQAELVLVTYTAPTTGPLTLTSLVQAVGDDGASGNNTATGSTAVSSSVADVAVWVSAPASASAGTTVTVSVDFLNLGGVAATGVSYELTLPSGLIEVACAGSGVNCSYNATTGQVAISGLPGTLAQGQGVGLTLTYSAPGAASGSVAVSGTVGAGNDANPANNSASAVTIINASATVPDVLSTVASPATAAPGSTVTVPVRYTNLGPDPASVTRYALALDGVPVANVEVQNDGFLCTLTGFVLSGCNLPAILSPGQTVDVVLTYGAPSAGTVTVTSDVAAEGETNLANNASTGSTTVDSAAPVPDVYTTVDAPVTAPLGGLVNALIAYGNQGREAAAEVSYSAVLPPGLSGVGCTGAVCSYDSATGIVVVSGLASSLSPGQTETVILSYIARGGGSVTVQTQIATTTPGEGPTNNNAASASTAVQDGPLADVMSWIGAPASANPGQTVSVAAGFTNLGSADASAVTYALSGLPAGASVSLNGAPCSYNPGTGTLSGCALPTTLIPGQAVELLAQFPAPVTGPVVITSRVGAGNDSNPSNNQASGRIVITRDTAADLTTTVAAPPSTVPGSTVTVPITYSNLGPSRAEGMGYRIDLTGSPADVQITYNGTACDYDSATGALTGCGLPNALSPGQTLPLTLTYRAPASGVVEVTSTVSSTTTEFNLSNNVASGSTTILGVPTVDVYALVDAPSSATAGAAVTVGITFGNQGSDTATGLGYSVLVPAGLTGVSCAGGVTCSYDPGSGLLTLSGLPGSLGPGERQTVTLTYMAPTVLGRVPVTARISAAEDPGFSGNNTASDGTLIAAAHWPPRVPPVSVPTLSQWGLMLLAILMVLVTVAGRPARFWR